jgi:NAD(P)-dependent dehydrogenase (short-subunit alcohol dehydrogenase family)
VPNAKLQGVAGDLGTRAGVDQFVKSVPNTDILVNNLGIFGPGDLFSSSDEDWERYFQINLMSGVRLTRAYLQGMMDRKWGRVVFLSSESGLNVPPDMLAYGFSKTAQVSIARVSRNSRQEQKLNEFVLATRGSSIIRRAASTEEVANMVVYACSMQASATTGAALRVDGGIVDSIA